MRKLLLLFVIACKKDPPGPDPCAALDECRELGACHQVAGKCRPTGDDCKQAKVCTELGRCALGSAPSFVCVAATDNDCRAAGLCRDNVSGSYMHVIDLAEAAA